ncbi:hypothetical protein ACIP5Y_21795 [Nocardia sp. NPDC088792]|uniref:hypothetical protein n=1 Tax=Nocardia sp. NPDC088792 TaxID=3364332 RepID=UPI00381BE351
MRKIAFAAIQAAVIPVARKAVAAARKLAAPIECVVRNGATTDRQLRHHELILIGDVLEDAGYDAEFIHSYGSPAGKAVAKVWRAEHRCEPPRVWTRHRTTGRPIEVCAYPADLSGRGAIEAGLRAYKRTAERFAA